MKTNLHRIALSAAIGVACLTAPSTHAANIWDGGGANNNWNTPDNWDNNLVPTFPASLTFAGSTRLTPNNDLSSLTLNGITFDAAAGAFVLGGNAVSLAGNIGFSGNPTSAITQTINMNVALTGATRTIITQANGNLVINGLISGSQNLTKDGAGTLTLTGSNTFVNIRINGGVLSASNLANGGSASSIGSASSGASRLVIDGGTLRYTGGTTSTNRNFSAGTNGSTINASGSGALTLSGDSPAFLGTNTARTITLTGTNTDENTLAANLADNGTGATTLAKTGLGTWVVTGNSTHTGGTTIGAGTLLINNTAGSGTGTGSVTVSGGILGGTGSVSGAVAVGSGSTLSPGASIGTLSTGALGMTNGSTFAYEVDSGSTGADLLKVTGNLSLTSTVNLTLNDIANSPVAFAEGTAFSLINYTGSWNSGLFTFDSQTIANGGIFTAGLNIWRLDYNSLTAGSNFIGSPSGSFVNMTAVPEPGAFSLLLAAVAVLAFLKRKRSAGTA